MTDADREAVALVIAYDRAKRFGTPDECADRIITALRDRGWHAPSEDKFTLANQLSAARFERDALQARQEALTGDKAVEAAADAVCLQMGSDDNDNRSIAEAAIAAALKATEGAG